MFRSWLDNQIAEFRGRILAIDLAVARAFAKLHIPHPRAERNTFITETAIAHIMTIVTRITADFEATGAKVFNPWEAQGR